MIDQSLIDQQQDVAEADPMQWIKEQADRAYTAMKVAQIRQRLGLSK